MKWTWSEKGQRFLEASTSLRVRFHEVDVLHVVWHGHYLAYFEEARQAFGRQYALDYHDVHAAGLLVPLVHVEVDYFAPARLGDLLTVRARLYPDLGARLNFAYLVSGPAGDRLATGKTVQVFTGTDGSLVMTRPRFYEEFLARWETKLLEE